MPNTEADSRAITDLEKITGEFTHVVAAIIWHPNNHDRFLIAQRQKGKHLEMLWEFPGGKIETGESRWQALQRELEEEIGIKALQGEPLIQIYHVYADRNILLDVWTVTAFDGQVMTVEQQALAWINISEIDQYQFPAADIPVLDLIQNR